MEEFGLSTGGFKRGSILLLESHKCVTQHLFTEPTLCSQHGVGVMNLVWPAESPTWDLKVLPSEPLFHTRTRGQKNSPQRWLRRWAGLGWELVLSSVNFLMVPSPHAGNSKVETVWDKLCEKQDGPRRRWRPVLDHLRTPAAAADVSFHLGWEENRLLPTCCQHVPSPFLNTPF